MADTPQSTDALFEDLSCSSRKKRQDAAQAIAEQAKGNPSSIAGHAEELVDALELPEAQTRWQVLAALTSLTSVDPTLVKEAQDGAESSLFDESSATVRLEAFRFLATLGAANPEMSRAVWPLLDEAAQVYHGDPEYREMLIALRDFSKGDIAPEVKDKLKDRIIFDAENGANGFIKSLSAEIVESLS